MIYINADTAQAQTPQGWFLNVPKDLLAVVAVVLIPEAIALSIIAGVDPEVGPYTSFFVLFSLRFLLYAFFYVSFTMAMTISFF